MSSHKEDEESKNVADEDFDDLEKQAENGKTELSLLHFSVRKYNLLIHIPSIEYSVILKLIIINFFFQIKNPTWQPTDSGKQYLESIREHGVSYITSS